METLAFQLRRKPNGIGADIVGCGGGHMGTDPDTAAQGIAASCSGHQATAIRIIEKVDLDYLHHEEPLEKNELAQIRSALKELLPQGIVLEESSNFFHTRFRAAT